MTEVLRQALPQSSYEEPLKEIGGWRFFSDEDGWIPSAESLAVVHRILAWKPGVDHSYATCIGNDGSEGTIRVERGADLPKGFSTTRTTRHRLFEIVNSKDFAPLREDFDKALNKLVDLVVESEHLTI